MLVAIIVLLALTNVSLAAFEFYCVGHFTQMEKDLNHMNDVLFSDEDLNPIDPEEVAGTLGRVLDEVDNLPEDIREECYELYSNATENIN